MAVNQYDSETISGSFNLGLSFFRWQHHTESDRELKKQGNSIEFSCRGKFSHSPCFLGLPVHPQGGGQALFAHQVVPRVPRTPRPLTYKLGTLPLSQIETQSVWRRSPAFNTSFVSSHHQLSSIMETFCSGGNICYMMVLGQYGAILVGTWWYWISIGR